MLKRHFSLLAVISVIVLSLVFAPVDSAAAQFADGTYNISYEMKEANNNNTSIADGYFQKPAKVTVSGGNATVQFTVTSAEMVQSLSASNGSLSVVSDSGNTRTYKLQTSVDNLSNPITMGMHIIVPKGTPGLEAGYDRQHSARAVFDVSGIAKAGGGGSDSGSEAGTSPEQNPKTGDNSPIVLYTILLVGAAGAFVLVRKLRPASE